MTNRWRCHEIVVITTWMVALAACNGGNHATDAAPDTADVSCGCPDLAAPDVNETVDDDVEVVDLLADVVIPGDEVGTADNPIAGDTPATDLNSTDLPSVQDVPAIPDLPLPSDEGVTPATIGVVSPAALKIELENKDFLLINVHVPNEGQIPGTDAHISYLDIPALTAYIGADLNVRTVVYCLSNYMSTIAGNALVGQGYRQVRYLDGGMSAWKGAGYPFEAPY